LILIKATSILDPERHGPAKPPGTLPRVGEACVRS
jgi:hypothetical protein